MASPMERDAFLHCWNFIVINTGFHGSQSPFSVLNLPYFYMMSMGKRQTKHLPRWPPSSHTANLVPSGLFYMMSMVFTNSMSHLCSSAEMTKNYYFPSQLVKKVRDQRLWTIHHWKATLFEPIWQNYQIRVSVTQLTHSMYTIGWENYSSYQKCRLYWPTIDIYDSRTVYSFIKTTRT